MRARGRFHEHSQDALDDDLVRYATRSTPLEISKGLIWTRARDGSPTTRAMPLLETRQERAALLILILAVTVAIGLGPFVSGLLGAAVLYVVLVRPYSRLERVSKAGIAAPVVLITALLLIALPAAWLVSSLIDQAPDALQRIQASDPLARLGRVRIGNSPSSVLSHHPPMPNAIIRLRQARTPRSIVLAATTVVLTRVATAQSGQHRSASSWLAQSFSRQPKPRAWRAALPSRGSCAPVKARTSRSSVRYGSMFLVRSSWTDSAICPARYARQCGRRCTSSASRPPSPTSRRLP